MSIVANHQIYTLRDYQQKFKDDIYKTIKKGSKKILCYAPTGSGKTIVIASILADALSRNKKAILLTNREFIIDQTLDTMTKVQIDKEQVGIIKAGYQENRERPLQIVGIQTQARRPLLNYADLLLIDECHTTCWFDTYKKLDEAFPNAIKMGFTASPWRRKFSTEYFGQWFEKLVKGPSIQELIDQGYLSEVRYFGYEGVDIARLESECSNPNRTYEDFSEVRQQQLYIDSSVPSQICEEMQNRCSGRSGIIFNAGVEQSQHQTELLLSQGIKAVHIDSDTPSRERRKIFDDLEKGEIQCISSVGCLTEGFDVKSISFIVLARATRSRALYIQMVGRGLRAFPDKKDCLVLDFGNNVNRIGEVTDSFKIPLFPPKNLSFQSKICPRCSHEMPEFFNICPKCFYRFNDSHSSRDFDGNDERDADFINRKFGELIRDKEYVRYIRKLRQTRFDKFLNDKNYTIKEIDPDGIWETVDAKHKGKDFKDAWFEGALFQAECSLGQEQIFLRYLYDIKSKTNKPPNWIERQYRLEYPKSPVPNLFSWHEILKVPPHASKFEVDKAFLNFSDEQMKKVQELNSETEMIANYYLYRFALDESGFFYP